MSSDNNISNNEREEDSLKIGNIDLRILELDLKIFWITIRRHLRLLGIVVLATTLIALLYVWFFKSEIWQAKCTLFRHTNIELLQTELPNIYKPVKMQVVIEMIRTRDNMREVIKRLRLRWSLDALYARTGVETEEGNENIIKISAVADNPAMAAKIANTLAEVFISEYVKMQGSAVKEIYFYYLKNQKITAQTLSDLKREEQEYLTQYNVISINSEIDAKLKQLNDLEVLLLQVKMTSSATQSKISNLETNINTLQRDIPLSYEVNSSDVADLDTLNKELYKLQQKYTNDNPRVKKLQSEVEYLENKIRQQAGKAPPPTKVTYGYNQVRSAMEELRYKTVAEAEGMNNNVKQVESAIVKLKSDLLRLTKEENHYYEIKRKIELNRDLQKKIDSMVSSLSFALDTNVSDVTMMEKAEAPDTPQNKHRRLIVLVGALVGIFLGLGFIVVREALDFTVKSEFDLEQVLRINNLGSLPPFALVPYKTFYAAIQIIYRRMMEKSACAKLPTLVVFGSVEPNSGKSFVIEKLTEIMKTQGQKVLYISSTTSLADDQMELAINDSIYWDKSVDYSLVSKNGHHMFFLLNDEVYKMPISKDMIPFFIAKLDGYDYILWELFDFGQNEQLFSAICDAATQSVLVTKFRSSRKLELWKCVHFLTKHGCRNLSGVLNNVDLPYFDREV